MERREEIFRLLQEVSEIRGLIGTSENLHLDCKSWPKDPDVSRVLGKAICGFANSEGGVIVFGLDARSPGKYDPDLIQGEIPVPDVLATQSRVEALVGDLVEPMVQGVVTAAVPDGPGSRSGFLLVSVPPTDGPPCRSRADLRFYQRITSGTYPMEYHQIADMFGRRRRPVLKLFLQEIGTASDYGNPIRQFVIGIENAGRAAAKFPSLRFKTNGPVGLSSYGVDGNNGQVLRQIPTNSDWIIFGGGADNIIYPGTTLEVARLRETSQGAGKGWVFRPFTLTAELAADEVESTSETVAIQELILP